MQRLSVKLWPLIEICKIYQGTQVLSMKWRKLLMILIKENTTELLFKEQSLTFIKEAKLSRLKTIFLSSTFQLSVQTEMYWLRKWTSQSNKVKIFSSPVQMDAEKAVCFEFSVNSGHYLMVDLKSQEQINCFIFLKDLTYLLEHSEIRSYTLTQSFNF